MKVKIKSKKGLIGIIVIAIILGVMLAVCLINNKKSKSDKTLIEYLKQVLDLKEETTDTEVETSQNIAVVPTMQDTLKSNSAWCPTFQLIWNDLKNEVVKQDIVFEEQLDIVDNLNKQEITEDMLNENSYFKIYGLKTLDLKKQIEDGIMNKFGETSNVINDINWSEDALYKEGSSEEKYIFYSMLKKKFTFEQEFTILEPSSFGGKYNVVQYFGVNSSTKEAVRKQVEVLYYNSDSDFAVELLTKEGDSVILARGENGTNFKEIYDSINTKKEKFDGNIYLQTEDRLMVPNIKINEKREYTELLNKKFTTKDGRTGEIEKAIQTIEFELDNVGGEVKSEAVMEATLKSALITNKNEPRYFNFDDKFTLFLKEDGKELPYLALQVTDISLYQ